MSLNVVRLTALLPLFSFAPVLLRPAHTATRVRLTLATLHAAALTEPRAATDSVDGPYFLVSVLGPGTKTMNFNLPATGHLSIHEDEALGARELVDLSLEPGDSVRLLVSVLEGKKVQTSDELAAAGASAKALLEPMASRVGTLSSALAPVTKGGAHWLGSAVLLLTNEGGTTYWRALECIATCKVLSGGAAVPFAGADAKPVGGVVELSGAGATYHMQLKGQQAPQ